MIILYITLNNVSILTYHAMHLNFTKVSLFNGVTHACSVQSLIHSSPNDINHKILSPNTIHVYFFAKKSSEKGTSESLTHCSSLTPQLLHICTALRARTASHLQRPIIYSYHLNGSSCMQVILSGNIFSSDKWCWQFYDTCIVSSFPPSVCVPRL